MPDKIYEAVPMVPPIETGCPVFPQIFRNGRMAGTKGSGRALTMNEQAHPFAVDRRAHGAEVGFADRRPDRRASHARAALLLAVGVGALLGMLVRRK